MNWATNWAINRRILAVTAAMALIATGALLVIGVGHFSPNKVHAQQGWTGAASVPGFYALGSNATVNAAIGSALATTNPASNFLMLVQGGPVYCAGGQQEVGQTTVQLAASNTYLLVYNCASSTLYAKTAITAPGSPAGNQPGVPLTFLAAIPGVEIPISTVVCNATACGNGGNGSITDNRPVAAFPGAGHPLNTTTFANLPTTNVTDGTMILCTNCAVAVGGVSATCTSGAVVNLAIREGGAWVCR